MINKVEIKSGTKTFYVKRPSAEQETAARTASARVFNEAVKRGDFFRAALDKVMREQGLWDDDKQREVEDLESKVEKLERKLAKGGMSLSEGKELATKIGDYRFRRLILLAGKRQYDANTIEGQQENYEFDHLFTLCFVDEEDEPVFKSVEEYRKSSEDYTGEAATKFSELHYGIKADWQKELPENKFLMKFGFVDENLRFVDGSGNFLSSNGRRVDENGRLINENGELVDEDGNRIDEKGNPVEDFAPFLDDDGNPVE